MRTTARTAAGTGASPAPGSKASDHPDRAQLTIRSNNISERGVRPLKTQQKVSGRLTSEDATQDRLDIRSYIDTCACRKPMPPGDTHESRLRRGRAVGHGSGPGR